MSCVFCRIVAGELPASVVYRDELCWALMDLQPVRRGHTLVIPAQHAIRVHELDHPVEERIWQLGQRLHVIPRSGGDLLRSLFRLVRNLAGLGAAPRAELDAEAERIRRHLTS